MVVYTEEISFRTTGEGQIVDITDDIETIVGRSGIRTGIVSSSVAGATAALTVIEYEPGLIEDFPRMLERIIPKGIDYAHHRTWDDGNGHSHVRHALLGPSLTIPFEDGRMTLGTWQQIVFIDFDSRPRVRSVVVQVIGE